MKKFVYLALVLWLTASGCAKNVPPAADGEKPKPQDQAQQDINTVSAYFPLEPDTMYTYKGEGNEYASKVVTVEYINGRIAQFNTNNGGTALSQVFVVGQGAVKKVFSKEESYWRENFITQKEQEEILLQQPLKVGTEWTSDGKKHRIVATDVKVTVPYGTFTAIKVTSELDDSTFSRYFAKGVGIVKEEFISGSAVVTSELAEVLKEPVKMRIELYYPDKSAERLITAKEDLLFNTNEGLGEKLFEVLQKPVVEGALATIPSKARLLAYQRENGAIRLNFSRDFVADANVGAEGEGLRIDAIVNTYGKAFAEEGVIINIEGEAYESGHFAFGKDEVIKVKD